MAQGADVKLIGSDFTDNSSETNGGAIYLSGSTLEINRSVMTGNTAASCGGAIMPNTSSTVLLNDITATGNSAASGGFLYNKSSVVTVYNSVIQNSSATGAGGAVKLQSATDTKFYNTLVKNNIAGTNAGAVAAYSGEAPILMHSCTFFGNDATNGFGGAIHVSTKANLTMYNTIARGNNAKTGGFMGTLGGYASGAALMVAGFFMIKGSKKKQHED